MKRSLIALAAAFSMAAAPALAQTSASKLSVVKSVRASAQGQNANQLEGNNLLLIGVAVAAVVALAVFVVFDDDEDSASN